MDQKYQETLEALSKAIPPRTWREATIENMMDADLCPDDTLELRVHTRKDRDYFALAQRAVNAFLTSFRLYPTEVRVHPTIAQLLICDDAVLKAEWHDDTGILTAIMGTGFTSTAIPIKSDASLTLDTVAVRFMFDLDANMDTVQAVIRRRISSHREQLL